LDFPSAFGLVLLYFPHQHATLDAGAALRQLRLHPPHQKQLKKVYNLKGFFFCRGGHCSMPAAAQVLGNGV